ncbi:MAG TPA: M56 family metallopeptidase, partial [Candidatus Eisenbacteria bacterium]|nr:M56 family metallopeptidase [Candidatus Eisenbacteria bacterium]
MTFSFDSPLVVSAAESPMLLMLLKVTLVLMAALAVSALMRRGSATVRHLVWLVALVAALAVPLLSLWSPLPVRVLPAVDASPAPTVRAEATPPVPHSVQPAPASAPSAATTAAAPLTIDVGTMLLALWALGVLVLLGRLALGAWVVSRLVRRARLLDTQDWLRPLYEVADRLGLDEAPRLVQSERIKMPFATGVWKTVIVLPAESAQWSHERRYAVLIHELAHIRRRDLLGHLVGGFACALYWFHPLVWTAARHLRAESERAADDLALVLGTPASDYAEHLLEIVTQVRDERMPAVALAMAKPREFEGRILAILDPGRRRRGPGR